MNKRSRLAALVLSALALVGVGLSAGSGEAAAGTNGQNIQLQGFDGLTGAYISGYNQWGEYTHQWVWLNPSGWGSVEGWSWWWWKGTVNIDWYWFDNSWFRQSNCWVPIDQGGWNYTTCGVGG